MTQLSGLVPDDPLPAAQERLLWLRFKSEGDMAAREHLITHYLRFARIMAARCYALRYRDGITTRTGCPH